MNFFSKLLGSNEIAPVLRENEWLRAEVDALKKELEITKLKQQLAEEQVISAMNLNKVLLGEPKPKKPN